LLHRIRGAEFNVLHVCGDENMLDLVLDYPVAAINWADKGAGNASLADVAVRTQRAVMGGIDHVRLGELSPAMVAGQAREAAGAGRRVLVAGGCGVSPLVGPENRDAVVAALRA
jgi:uroporphyrinogen decarboxylase